MKLELNAAVTAHASQCVKCALCLPHCPTYLLSQDENESPRGRIALFQAVAQSQLDFSDKVDTHLDQCLGCRACERVCPAHVAYGELLTLGRTLTHEEHIKHQKPPFTLRLLSWILTHRLMQKWLQWCLWRIEKSGLRHFARRTKLTQALGLTALDNLLPPPTKPRHFEPIYAPIGTKRGTVMLFTGCISSLCDQETLAASIHVLRHLGMEVHVPTAQVCCGAIGLHAGELTQAYGLAQKNLAAFSDEKIAFDYIITTATGCSATLQEYPDQFSLCADSKMPALEKFSAKVIDIVRFVQQSEWPETLALKALPLHIMLHTPCTLRNVLKTPIFAEQLLSRIPELSWQSFSSPHCCGAAGTYMLSHPEIAAPLAAQLLKEVTPEIKYIATANIGCALHLQQQLKKTQPDLTVTHVIQLVAKALGF